MPSLSGSPFIEPSAPDGMSTPPETGDSAEMIESETNDSSVSHRKPSSESTTTRKFDTPNPNSNALIQLHMSDNTSGERSLQSIDNSSSSMIQIPSAILASLLNNLDSLRNELTLLQTSDVEAFRGQISHLRDELQILDVLTGPNFQLFPKLPIELRIKIWRHAIDIPRVVTLEETSPRPGFFGVNKEARLEALKIYEPHHFCDLRPEFHHLQNLSEAYINFNLDTLWFDSTYTDDNDDDYLDDYIYDPVLELVSEGLKSNSLVKGRSGPSINSLALHYSMWYGYYRRSHRLPEFLDHLREMGVMELVLVVGDDNDYFEHRKVEYTLIAPSLEPKCLLQPDLMYGPNNRIDAGWADLESAVQLTISNFVEERASLRKTFLDDGLTAQDLDSRPQEEHLTDLSNWNTPRVVFREPKILGKHPGFCGHSTLYLCDIGKTAGETG